MRAIITIFKVELKGKESVLTSMGEMSSDFSEVGEAYILSPKAGKLFDLLNFLRDNNVNYGTHFNVVDGEGLPDK